MATWALSGQQATDSVSLETRDKHCTPVHLSVTLSYYTCKWKKGETEEGKVSCFEKKNSENKNGQQQKHKFSPEHQDKQGS